MRLALLMSLSILLAGCNSDPKPPRVVTHYEAVKVDLPAELLRCAHAPDPAMLTGVRFAAGREKAKRYTKALVLANYRNCQKIHAIKRIVR